MKRLRVGNGLRRALGGRSRGFSLIELVIAIALIGIIGVTILTALSGATLALIIADQRATAESLARTQIEFVKNSDYDYVLESGHPVYALDPGIQPLPSGYSVATVAVRLNQDENPNDDDGIQLITVTVTYYTLRADNAMREQTYILEDYKVRDETED